MVAERWGSIDTVEGVTAARDVSPGHLHLCPDGRVGVYMGAQDVASGGTMTLHTNEVLRLDAAAIAAASAGATVNFNFTTQTIVASGGTNCGTYVFDKALNATKAVVALNDGGATV
jgi:hypothetical protein